MRTDSLIRRRGILRRLAPLQSGKTDIVATTVNLQRTPTGLITVWVEAPDGEAGGIELDSLDRRKAGAGGFVSWAEEQLGMKARSISMRSNWTRA